MSAKNNGKSSGNNQQNSDNKLTRNNQQKSKSDESKSDEENEIPKELITIIESVPVEKRSEVKKALFLFAKHHSGPLPDSDTIRVYNECIPNGGDRLMKNVEKQLDHRIELEKYGTKRAFNQSGVGQIFGFTIAIIFGLIAWDLTKNGHELPGIILGSVDLVALVSVFLIGRKQQQ